MLRVTRVCGGQFVLGRVALSEQRSSTLLTADIHIKSSNSTPQSYLTDWILPPSLVYPVRPLLRSYMEEAQEALCTCNICVQQLQITTLLWLVQEPKDLMGRVALVSKALLRLVSSKTTWWTRFTPALALRSLHSSGDVATSGSALLRVSWPTLWANLHTTNLVQDIQWTKTSRNKPSQPGDGALKTLAASALPLRLSCSPPLEDHSLLLLPGRCS